MKVVINSDFGGFSLSDEAVREYAKRKGLTLVEERNEEWGDNTFYLNSIAEENYFSSRDVALFKLVTHYATSSRNLLLTA